MSKEQAAKEALKVLARIDADRAAMSDAQEALRLWPKRPAFLLLRAQLHQAMGKAEPAANDHRAAIKEAALDQRDREAQAAPIRCSSCRRHAFSTTNRISQCSLIVVDLHHHLLAGIPGALGLRATAPSPTPQEMPMARKRHPDVSEPDGLYTAIIDAHGDLNDAESVALNARLVLLLANHIGDLAVVREAIAMARKSVCRSG